MGFEPRAAERLRLVVASASGALDDIAHLLAEPERQRERKVPTVRARSAGRVPPASQPRSARVVKRRTNS
jgi:hypothetical protein